MSAADLTTTALEKAINRVLALDPELVEGLAELSDKRVAVHVQDMGLRICLRPGPGGIALERPPVPATSAPDVTISGSAWTLTALAYRARNEADAPFPDDVQVRGDVELLQRLLALLAGAQLDWEEWLAALAGDAAGHQLARALRGLIGWSVATRRRFEVTLGEYLREEVRMLPEPIQFARFAGDVDRLRDDVERLEQRVRRLHRHPPGRAIGRRS